MKEQNYHDIYNQYAIRKVKFHKVATSKEPEPPGSNPPCRWDPDRDIYGNPIGRRAIQLELQGEMLADYVNKWIVEISDITDFVHTMQENISKGTFQEELMSIEWEEMMNIKVTLERKEEIEKFALVLCVGITTCLRKNVLSIDEAQKILFSPHSVDRLKKGGARRAIQDLILLACELEDVASLIPESLDKSILEIQNKAIELLRAMEEMPPEWEKWID